MTQISGISTTATAVGQGYLFEGETTGGTSEKVPAQLIGAAFGSSFPGSPSTGDRFYRTDRHIDYFYDGTRWLSTQIFTLEPQVQDATTPMTASGNLRVANPWWNLYDIYVERLVVGFNSTTTTASNYFTAQISLRDGASVTAIGSGVSGQSITQNAFVNKSENVNTVVSNSVEVIAIAFTETGTSSTYLSASFTYRLVG